MSYVKNKNNHEEILTWPQAIDADDRENECDVEIGDPRVEIL